MLLIRMYICSNHQKHMFGWRLRFLFSSNRLYCAAYTKRKRNRLHEGQNLRDEHFPCEHFARTKSVFYCCLPRIRAHWSCLLFVVVASHIVWNYTNVRIQQCLHSVYMESDKQRILGVSVKRIASSAFWHSNFAE